MAEVSLLLGDEPDGRGRALDVPDTTYPALFEAQVARTPDATALVCGDDRLTFAEVEARANRLAHHLVREGVRPEQVVALSLPRGVDAVIGILGVLKAGAVHLPVDPGLPERGGGTCWRTRRGAGARRPARSTAVRSNRPPSTCARTTRRT
ncbi:AMP-binding protein [Saccharothrix sp. MB29]|nr:AMP-binding protein [Saccharothrix sp. MB29]